MANNAVLAVNVETIVMMCYYRMPDPELYQLKHWQQMQPKGYVHQQYLNYTQ